MLSPRKNEPFFNYWISFWPVAPMFGVAWRFEKALPTPAVLGAFTAVTAPAPKPGVTAPTSSKPSATPVVARVVPQTSAPVEDAEVVEAPKAVAPTATAAKAAAPAARPAPSADLFEPAAPKTTDAAPAADDAAPATLYAAPPALVDDLKQIKGVGPKLEAMLNELGIYRFDQIAAFTDANLAWVDDKLTVFKGRPLRDDWVAQARALL